MTQTTHELAQCLRLQNDQFRKALEIIRLLENEVIRQDKEIRFLKDLNRIQTKQIKRLLATMATGATIQNPNHLCRPCNSLT